MRRPLIPMRSRKSISPPVDILSQATTYRVLDYDCAGEMSRGFHRISGPLEEFFSLKPITTTKINPRQIIMFVTWIGKSKLSAFRMH